MKISTIATATTTATTTAAATAAATTAAAAAAEAASEEAGPPCFDGRVPLFKNLLPGEAPSAGHVSIDDLSAGLGEGALLLATSLFPGPSYDWLHQKLSGRVASALLVADPLEVGAKGRALPELRARDSGWRVLEGRPQGCLHCGLLLLRASTFLRVVVCGSNLDGQLERDRDALFVQDRPPRYLVITPSSSCRTAPPPPRRAAVSDI